MSEQKGMDDLRKVIFDAIEGVKSGAVTVEKAKAMNALIESMIGTAKVEVEYMKATGAKNASGFLEKKPDLPPGVTNIRQNRLT